MNSPNKGSPKFSENLRAPGWMFAFLGLMLGATSGILTAVGIRNFGDDPLVSGGEALVFYICFAIAIVGIVYVMLSSTLMQTVANSDGLTISLGVLGTQRTFSWDSIARVETVGHNIARHGGRGNPFAPASRRAWTMYGVRSGVEMEIMVEGGDQIVFVSSRKGDELVGIANNLIGSKVKVG